MMNRQDLERGTLIGLAVDDAIGAAVEFRRPATFPEVTGYRGDGLHRVVPGERTDDTSMALAVADSIAEVGSDPNDQAERYLKWWRTGKYSVNGRCFDIGNTTVAALHRFQRSDDARTSGNPSERPSGNGSIMRLPPVPIQYSHMGQMESRIAATKFHGFPFVSYIVLVEMVRAGWSLAAERLLPEESEREQ